ncbi:MAG: hypothetical protein HOI95_14965 [Chromatiales bacterium]|jgi:catechol 2,3-dioxygenase-like lactoylglutathione lyase family enzyme|nr:hypothetical protein [Chromatiales bacterium]
MTIARFDHAAIPAQNLESMLTFYANLGFQVNRDRAPNLFSVHFGDNKINIHAPDFWQSEKFTLRGPTAAPGCGDFCFVWEGSQSELDQLLALHRITVIEGPASREGGLNGGRATGQSTYIRDPDGNLLEFIIY